MTPAHSRQSWISREEAIRIETTGIETIGTENLLRVAEQQATESRLPVLFFPRLDVGQRVAATSGLAASISLSIHA